MNQSDSQTLEPPAVPASATIASGVTSARAAELLASNGPNTVADIAEHPARRALKKLWAPVPWMLEAGDFLAMSSSTDNVHPSNLPSVWHIGPLSIAGIMLGFVDLLFCIACLAAGKFALGLDTAALQTLAVVTLVFGSQAVFYVARERRHLWSSRPGHWLLLSSVIDVLIVSVLALKGLLMAPLAPAILVGLFLAAAVFALVLDSVKSVLFRHLRVA